MRLHAINCKEFLEGLAYFKLWTAEHPIQMIINLLAVIVYLLLLVLSPVPRAAMEDYEKKRRP